MNRKAESLEKHSLTLFVLVLCMRGLGRPIKIHPNLCRYLFVRFVLTWGYTSLEEGLLQKQWLAPSCAAVPREPLLSAFWPNGCRWWFLSRITGKFHLEGLSEVSGPAPCSEQAQVCGQTGLLRVWPKRVLKPPGLGIHHCSLPRGCAASWGARFSLWWFSQDCFCLPLPPLPLFFRLKGPIFLSLLEQVLGCTLVHQCPSCTGGPKWASVVQLVLRRGQWSPPALRGCSGFAARAHGWLMPRGGLVLVEFHQVSVSLVLLVPQTGSPALEHFSTSSQCGVICRHDKSALGCLLKSVMKTLTGAGPRTEPCGAPLVTSLRTESSVLISELDCPEVMGKAKMEVLWGNWDCDLTS